MRGVLHFVQDDDEKRATADATTERIGDDEAVLLFLFSEELVELLFIGVVVEIIVEVGAGLHGVTTCCWVPSERMCW